MNKYANTIGFLSAIIISAISTPLALADFKDVPESHNNFTAINYVQSQNIVSGYPDGTFKPDNKINRAEFIKIFVNSLTSEPSGSNCFSDVKDEWYSIYVCYAKDKGIIDGYKDNSFKPGSNINYAEAGKIIVMASGIPTEDGDPSKDPWFKKFTSALNNYSAIPDSISVPNRQITRGEMAEIIYRTRKRDEIYLSTIKTCSIPSSGDLVELGDNYFKEYNFSCAGAAYTYAIQDKNSLAKISQPDLLNIANEFAATENSYLAIKLLNDYISESSITSEKGKELYNLVFAQSYYQTRQYDKAIKYANKVIATTSINSYHGYKARQIEFTANLETDKPETKVSLADLQSITPPVLDTFMVKEAIIHNGNITDKPLPSEEDFFAKYVPENHLIYRAYYLTLLAQIHNSQSSFTSCENLLREAIQTDPNYLPAYLEYGRMYENKGEYNKAILYHQKALEIDPNYYKANNLIGYMIYEAIQAGQRSNSDYELAITYLNASLKTAPEYARPYNTLGVIYANNGNHEEAIEYFLKALKYEDYLEPYMNLALTYKALGQDDKAVEYFKKAKEHSQE